ncbi:hypothetical protein [Cryobacterium zhongshanensis]|uniref:Uncharacterized protein n=1 Tax=Cryobacterium zhongshanensis TaxID=2928153 RepID=A0AA41QZ13_9MICO|nr:hypothetical protein [Cryobacterium zhongshanensis]MCI4659729.1 hypothetical protein [Cryobacterium zhongshanensis]
MYSPENSEEIRESLSAMEENAYKSGYRGSTQVLSQARWALTDADKRIKELEDTVVELTSRVAELTASQSSNSHEAVQARNEKKTARMRKYPELAPDSAEPATTDQKGPER